MTSCIICRFLDYLTRQPGACDHAMPIPFRWKGDLLVSWISRAVEDRWKPMSSKPDRKSRFHYPSALTDSTEIAPIQNNKLPLFMLGPVRK